jgi:hypothetical protein
MHPARIVGITVVVAGLAVTLSGCRKHRGYEFDD